MLKVKLSGQLAGLSPDLTQTELTRSPEKAQR